MAAKRYATEQIIGFLREAEKQDIAQLGDAEFVPTASMRNSHSLASRFRQNTARKRRTSHAVSIFPM
jgi:hypothetical protein